MLSERLSALPRPTRLFVRDLKVVEYNSRRWGHFHCVLLLMTIELGNRNRFYCRSSITAPIGSTTWLRTIVISLLFKRSAPEKQKYLHLAKIKLSKLLLRNCLQLTKGVKYFKWSLLELETMYAILTRMYTILEIRGPKNSEGTRRKNSVSVERSQRK